MSARSLLFSTVPPLRIPDLCKPGRQEAQITFRKDGRLYTMTARDRVIPEDPFLVLVKAAAFAASENEPYMGRAVPRAVKDFLIKSNAVI